MVWLRPCCQREPRGKAASTAHGPAGSQPRVYADDTYASRSSRSRLIRFSSRTFQASYSSSSFSSSVSSASSAASERLFSSSSFFASSSTICSKEQVKLAAVPAAPLCGPQPAPQHLERVLAPLLRQPLCLLLQLLLLQGFCFSLLNCDPVLPAGRDNSLQPFHEPAHPLGSSQTSPSSCTAATSSLCSPQGRDDPQGFPLASVAHAGATVPFPYSCSCVGEQQETKPPVAGHGLLTASLCHRTALARGLWSDPAATPTLMRLQPTA